MVRIKHDKPSGILNTRAARDLRRYWPSDDLAPFVEHYWIVRWDVEEPVTAETLPHPSVHMVLERPRSEVVGVMRGRFTRQIEGVGRVIGTKFRPGAFRAFIDRSVASLTDRRWPLSDLFGARVGRFHLDALDHDDDWQSIAFIESFLRSFRPAATVAMDVAARITARIAEDRNVTRVEQVAEEFVINPRAMQRLFREYVGVTPKWVIQQYRLIEAAERLAAGSASDIAALAFELGYADQAHFTRDFRRIVGRPPAAYRGTFEVRS